MEGHHLSVEQAKALIAGPLGDQYREILRACCVPIYWFARGDRHPSIAHNGTLTIVRTPQKLLGITAAHVFRQYQQDCHKSPHRLQLMNEVVDDLQNRLIAISDDLDLASFELDEPLVQRLGRTALSVWPPRAPQEGRGILIAGFPGVDRKEDTKKFEVNFGLFTVIGIARTVTDVQITWAFEREHQGPMGRSPYRPKATTWAG